MVVADQANMFPSEWRNMGDRRFWNVFSPFAQGLNRFGEIDRVPGSNGRHDDMQATGSMHLILKRPIAQFAEPPKEELARESMKRFSFIQADQHPPPEGFVAKIFADYVEYNSPVHLFTYSTVFAGLVQGE
jgi:hypothetical protein